MVAQQPLHAIGAHGDDDSDVESENSEDMLDFDHTLESDHSGQIVDMSSSEQSRFETCTSDSQVKKSETDSQ